MSWIRLGMGWVGLDLYVCGLGWVVGYENGPMDNSAIYNTLQLGLLQQNSLIFTSCKY